MIFRVRRAAPMIVTLGLLLPTGVFAQDTCLGILDPEERLACIDNATFSPAPFFDISALTTGATLGESLPGSGCFGCDADGTPSAPFGFGMSAQILKPGNLAAVLTTENAGLPQRCLVSYFYTIKIGTRTESGYETSVDGKVFTDVFKVFDGTRTFRLTPRPSTVKYEWVKLDDVQWICRPIEPALPVPLP
jgi:hypothetical protein